MRPEERSNRLLGITRSKAKMIEYNVLEQYQNIDLSTNPNKLLTISIGMLGDLTATINREDNKLEVLTELRKNLLFSARFFDSYIQTKLDVTLNPYLVLLGSASYYLCDLPGSASVLAKYISGECPDLDGEGLEDLLLWLLQADLETYFDGSYGPFGLYIDKISESIIHFFKNGTNDDEILDLAQKLRKAVYELGSPRQLLFGDVIAALLRKKIQNSCWNALPTYSGISRDRWLNAIQKDTFIKELWPAQHLLGKKNVLKGKSAIVQMPTSAGKTKATELILRSAFLADRVKLAIIIAPFRALCHEIKNSLLDAFRNESIKVDELSDALQTDFEIEGLLGHQQILVVTPEKLVYVLRHNTDLTSNVGLIIFDEGHQFDSGTRGITYELLLTSLRSMLPEGAQKVLISAVISNAASVGEWLNKDSNVVEGTNLNPTFRSVGFTSWLDQLGRIEYVDNLNAEQKEFFVPRVIEKYNLGKKGKEQNDRFFPEKFDGKSIALYLGIKLAPNGGVAIFCGKKSTAANICEKAVDIIERGLPLTLPIEFSDQLEVERLKNLYAKNLGTIASSSKSAEYGIFSHHGNTPHGIRLAVEYAMRLGLVRLVVCTSTLAQGVNLPIRYLIVTSVYQGMERIKVRDFHNLIGRAGRAGMHTEGSILFADPNIYDKRNTFNDKWRWIQVKELLNPMNSEPCISNLLSIFDPITSDDDKFSINMEPLDFVNSYVNNPAEVSKLAANIAKQHGDKGFSKEGVERQVVWRMNLINAVESFLLYNWDETENGLLNEDVIQLAEGTLAFFLADDQKKEHIRELFSVLASNISKTITDPVRRKTYGRTLYGIQDAKNIEIWVKSNESNLFSIADDEEIIELIWPLLTEQINVGIFTKFDKPEVLKDIAIGWIKGESFNNLLQIIVKKKVKMVWGTRRRKFSIENIVDVCEGTLAYDGALLVSALCEFIELINQEGTSELINRLQLFQKRLKYGLPTETTVALYELGFSDRVISQDLAIALNLSAILKNDVTRHLKKERKASMAVLAKYPKYFQERLKEILE